MDAKNLEDFFSPATNLYMLNFFKAYPAFGSLCEALALDLTETAVLALAFGAEIGEEEVILHLEQNKLLYPTPGLVKNLLGLSNKNLREIFWPEKKLLGLGLIEFLPAFEGHPFYSRPYRLLEPLLDRFLDLEPQATRFKGLIEEIVPSSCQCLSSEVKSVEETALLAKKENRPLFLNIAGQQRPTEVVLEEILWSLGVAGWQVNLSYLLSQTDPSRSFLVIAREALLSGKALIIKGDDYHPWMTNILNRLGWLVIWRSERPLSLDGLSERWLQLVLHIDFLSRRHRQKIWQEILERPDGSSVLATYSPVSRHKARLVKQIFSSSKSLELSKTLSQLILTGPSPFLNLIIPKRDLSYLVLPENELQKLKLLATRLRHSFLIEEWGLFQTAWPRLGVNVLFRGPSGTGKTLAAEALASELGRPLVKVDLASVVSKWVGETEKHLSQIFDQIVGPEVILFFDEADALFGRRTLLKDSRDRYANLEVNHLLQKIENHEGLVILASNLTSNIDEAFLRRIDLVVNFPVPDEEARKAIWQKMLSPEIPLEAEVDISWLARRFRLTGGQIRNAVLTAAFLGAEKGKVGPKELLQAIELEFEKIGTSFGETNLGT